MKKITTALLGWLFALAIFSQEQPTGTWHSYPAFGEISKITTAAKKIYAVSIGNIFSFNTDDNSIEYFTKENGLSDINAQNIAYDARSGLMVIVYSNSNIDITSQDGKLYNLPDYMNKPMTASKTVNDISFDGKFCYLSTDFGIVVINMEKKEIAETYTLNRKVYNVIVINNEIYAMTDNGIYKGERTNNLLDNNNWERHSREKGKKIAFFNGTLYMLDLNGALYSINDDGTKKLMVQDSFIDMYATQQLLIYYKANQVTQTNVDNNTITTNIPFNINMLQYSATTKSYWTGEGFKGLLSFKPEQGNDFTPDYYYILPDGPMANTPFYMNYSYDRLMVAGGGRWGNRYFRTGSIMLYEDKDWTNFNPDSIRDIKNRIDYMDIVSLVADPLDKNHIYAASCGDGLYEFQNNKLVTLHSLDNSALESALSATDPSRYAYVRVDALSFDNKNNLWMSNYLVDNSIKVLKNDGNWLSLSYPSLARKATISQINHMSNGHKWIILPRNIDECGLFVLNTNNNLEDQSKHKTVYFHTFTDTEGKTITPGGVYCAVEDRNGVIWVGTDKGPLLFPSPNRVFDTNFRCTRIKIPLEDNSSSNGNSVLASYLLEKEQLNCIAIDGGNRKWIGTEANGLFVLSPDGKKTIHHFTVNNSPLPSNIVKTLAINPKTGEVFIGCDTGLVSYMSDSSEPTDNYNNVNIFPNPVRPEFEGVITIRGLQENSDVIISDNTGRIIYRTISVGGEATWNGRDANGQKVSSGVYPVMCATEDGKKGVVAKIMVIK